MLDILLKTELSESEKISFMRTCNENFFGSLMGKFNMEETIEKIIVNADFISVEDNASNKCGYIAFYCNNYDTKQAYITLICIDEKYQHLGLGTILLKKCYEICKSRGFKSIRLEVKNNNEKAIKFYKKNGFEFENEASHSTKYMKYILK